MRAAAVPLRRQRDKGTFTPAAIAECAKPRLRIARLTMLTDAATSLLQGADPDAEVLPALLEAMRNELSVDATLGFVVTDLGDGLNLAFAQGLDRASVDRCLRLDFGQAICGTVAATGRPLHVTDIQNSTDRRADLVREMGITAYACEPLIANDRVTGTISFASRTRRSFDEEDLAFFRLIARHVALARQRGADRALAQASARELRHRVGNLLSTIQAVASISARTQQSMDKFIRSLSDRIVALGSVQELLGRSAGQVDLRELLLSLLDQTRTGAARLDGPAVQIPAAVAVPLGMAVHELWVNAGQFGSLSSANGTLSLRWRVAGDRVRIKWKESGGRPVSPPTRDGFGSKLLNGLLGSRVRVERRFAPEGLDAVIEVTLSEG